MKYDYTNSMLGSIKNMDYQQIETVHTIIDEWMKSYKESKKEYKGLEVAHAYHKEMQSMIDEEIDRGHEIACSKGCSFCCKTDVHITDDEADLLVELIKQNDISINMDRLENQSFVKHHGDWWRLGSDIPCVFLDENNGECKAYDYRPMSCRKLMVVSEPDQCDTISNPNREVARLVAIRAEALATAIFTSTRSDSMAKLLYEKLK